MADNFPVNPSISTNPMRTISGGAMGTGGSASVTPPTNSAGGADGMGSFDYAPQRPSAAISAGGDDGSMSIGTHQSSAVSAGGDGQPTIGADGNFQLAGPTWGGPQMSTPATNFGGGAIPANGYGPPAMLKPDVALPPQAAPFPGGVPKTSNLPPQAVANQYGQNPINPFSAAGVPAPQFSGQGAPPGPPKMGIPGQTAANPAFQYTNPVDKYKDANPVYPSVSNGGKLWTPPPNMIGQTPQYVSPVDKYKDAPITASPSTNGISSYKPPASMIGTSTPSVPSVSDAGSYKPPSATTAPSYAPQMFGSLPSPAPLGQSSTPSASYHNPATDHPTLGQTYLSDEREKKDIAPAEDSPKFPTLDMGALDAAQERAGKDVGSRFAMPDTWQPASDLRNVHNYHYNYIDPHAPGADEGPQLGGMAQEHLQNKTLQHTVKTGPDGRLAVDTGRVAMALPGAIGETQSQVSKQQAQIDTMAQYIKNHMKQNQTAQQDPNMLPPDWSYKPTNWASSDERGKKDIKPDYTYDKGAQSVNDPSIVDPWADDTARGKVVDHTGEEDQKKKANWDFVRKVGEMYKGAVSQPIEQFRAPGVASPYAGSDVRNKTNIQPADYRQASFPTPMAPASAPRMAPPAPPPARPAEPVGTRERALAAGYAWLAAHGDAGANHHEESAAPLPAYEQQAAARSMGEQIPQYKPEGYDAMRSSEYGLPSPEEADMQAIINEVEARRKANQGQR